MNTSSMRSTTNPFVEKTGRSHWQYTDPDHIDLGSYTHSGPPSDRAETASLPRRPRPEYPRVCCPTPRAPEVGPTRVEGQHHPRPTYGALDHTAELLAKLLSGSEDPDVTALSEAIKAKLGIAEPLPKPVLSSPSTGLSTLTDDLKRSRVSRLLPKVTCPSPFHHRARTVPIAELQHVPVTETEKRGLSALAPLAGVSPSGLTPGGGKTGRPIAQANIQQELPESDPKNLPEWAEEFAEFLLLTDQSHVDVATKCSVLKRSCKKKFWQKQVKQIVKTCSTWAELLQRLGKMFPVYDTDLSVRTQIEELPMLPKFPSAARILQYVCDLEYLFSRMNVGSYGATEPHLWLISKIPQRTWDDCRSTSERKSRTHSYDELVDLLIELALERENDSSGLFLTVSVSRCPAPSARARRPWRCESSRPCPYLPRARGTGPSCGGRQSTAGWHPGRRPLVGRRGPQGVLQEGLRRVRPVQGVLLRQGVRLWGVHLVGVLQGVLMVLRQGVPVGLHQVASVGSRMGASS